MPTHDKYRFKHLITQYVQCEWVWFSGVRYKSRLTFFFSFFFFLFYSCLAASVCGMYCSTHAHVLHTHTHASCNTLIMTASYLKQRLSVVLFSSDAELGAPGSGSEGVSAAAAGVAGGSGDGNDDDDDEDAVWNELEAASVARKASKSTASSKSSSKPTATSKAGKPTASSKSSSKPTASSKASKPTASSKHSTSAPAAQTKRRKKE
jgi:hypothetical protein